MRTMFFGKKSAVRFVLAAASALGVGVLAASAAVDTNDFNADPASSPTRRPAVVAYNGESVRDPLIKVAIFNADTAVVPGSIRLYLGTNELAINELTPLVVTVTRSGAEAQFQITNYFSAGTTQNASVVFTDNDTIPVTQTNTWSFTVGPFKGGSRTLFVEAEDFNYSIDGVSGGLHANFGDPDCPLLGSNGVRGVDFAQGDNNNDTNALPAYRPLTDVEAAKPFTDVVLRGDHIITCSYIVGWNDPGDWQNYTRVFTNNTRYNVYARLSSGGLPEAVEFARITSDPTLPNQTKEVIGEFRAPATGNWDAFHTVPLRNAANELVSIRLTGTNTFRISHLPGNFDINYFAVVEADIPFIPAGLQSFDPPPGSDYARQPAITAIFRDEDSQVVPESVRMFYDGTGVTFSATRINTPDGAEIIYQVPTASPTGAVHTVEVRWTDNQATPLTQTFSWSYREGIYNAESNLFIEMEDFNTEGGVFFPSNGRFPFDQKGLYFGYSGTTGRDFNDAGNPEPQSNLYRLNETPNVGMSPLNDANRSGAGPRPGFETVSDYKIGWTTPNVDWYNYTRDFRAGSTYNVYLRAAHGDTNAATTIAGRLDHLDDPASPTPVITPLGNFRAPTTGGWDTFTFVPLKDTLGNLMNVALSGIQTLRYTVEANGGVIFGSDLNYLMFVPAAPGPALTITRSGNNVTITWPSGNLQSAPAITGPWTTETGAASPLQLNNTTGMRFYRTIAP